MKHSVVVVLGMVSACAPEHPGEHHRISRTAPTSPPRDDPEDVVAYAELCKHELGIAGPLPAMSCLAGTQIPITVDGKPLDDELYEHLRNGGGCDRPQWLGAACHNYDLVQRIEIAPDIDAVLICRQKYFASPLDKRARAAAVAHAAPAERLERFRTFAEFDDLGLILRDRRSGKTCFFTAFNHQLYGGWVPPPDLTRLPPRAAVVAAIAAVAAPAPPAEYPEDAWYRDARATYLSPRDTAAADCLRCHDLGAFKHSPFIDQTDVVPSNDDLPYLLVGTVFQDAFRTLRLREITTEPIDGEPQACTSCHRMTSGGQTCASFLDWSIGRYPYALSRSARQFPMAAWMPFDRGGHRENAHRFARQWGRHVERTKCCCEHPDARGCLSRSFGPTADALDHAFAPAPALGAGAESCL